MVVVQVRKTRTQYVTAKTEKLELQLNSATLIISCGNLQIWIQDSKIRKLWRSSQVHYRREWWNDATPNLGHVKPSPIQCISTLFTDLVTAGVGPMPAGTPQTMAPEVIDCMLGERSSEFAADGAGKCWSIMVYYGLLVLLRSIVAIMQISLWYLVHLKFFFEAAFECTVPGRNSQSRSW